MKQETRRRHRTATASAALPLAALAGGSAEPADRTADRVGRAAATGESASAPERVSEYSASGALAGSSWRLVEFQSMDDATGTIVPKDPSRYTMRLKEDGTVVMRLDCNRATGTWSAEPGDDVASGRFEFGPLAVTRALCPPPSLGESIAAQAEYIRSYVRRYGKLYLALMADAGIYVWEPDPDAPSTQDVPRAPDEGGPRNWEVSDASSSLQTRPASLPALPPARSSTTSVAVAERTRSGAMFSRLVAVLEVMSSRTGSSPRYRPTGASPLALTTRHCGQVRANSMRRGKFRVPREPVSP